MMTRLAYNIGLLAGLILALPWLLVKALRVPGYAGWVLHRLGWADASLSSTVFPNSAASPNPTTSPRIWLHALSVGETASVRPLLRALRAHYPQAVLMLSSSTRAGATLAAATCANLVDCRLVMPYDLPGAATRIIRRLRPDLFILVETDFWPNLLGALAAAKVPMLLINGRMSPTSWNHYRILRFWARPLLFAPFTFLAMQTKAEVDRMVALGLTPARVGVIGNLKYTAAAAIGHRPKLARSELGIGAHKLLWVAGSTHAGEEEIILRAFRRLVVQWPDLFLVLAPRRVERAAMVLALAKQYGYRVALRREPKGAAAKGATEAEVVVLNSYGELVDLYSLGTMVFIGGSLVPAGGHNPLEAAVWEKPVLFGPHMEDFAEISEDLLAVNGALQVQNEDELVAGLQCWLADPNHRAACGRRGGELVRTRDQGVLAAHLALIERLQTTKINNVKR